MYSNFVSLFSLDIETFEIRDAMPHSLNHAKSTLVRWVIDYLLWIVESGEHVFPFSCESLPDLKRDSINIDLISIKDV